MTKTIAACLNDAGPGWRYRARQSCPEHRGGRADELTPTTPDLVRTGWPPVRTRVVAPSCVRQQVGPRRVNRPDRARPPGSALPCRWRSGGPHQTPQSCPHPGETRPDAESWQEPDDQVVALLAVPDSSGTDSRQPPDRARAREGSVPAAGQGVADRVPDLQPERAQQRHPNTAFSQVCSAAAAGTALDQARGLCAQASTRSRG